MSFKQLRKMISDKQKNRFLVLKETVFKNLFMTSELLT